MINGSFANTVSEPEVFGWNRIPNNMCLSGSNCSSLQVRPRCHTVSQAAVRSVDLHSLDLCALFFTSCVAMEFSETGHWQKKRPDLPVSLLMVLHALRLEGEKSMELTASSHGSCFFCLSRDNRDESALSVSPHQGSGEGVIEGLALFVPVWHTVLPMATWDTLFRNGQ